LYAFSAGVAWRVRASAQRAADFDFGQPILAAVGPAGVIVRLAR
jgi:hypothetical protein